MSRDPHLWRRAIREVAMQAHYSALAEGAEPIPFEMRLLTPEQVADWLQVKVETLATWRSAGRGPRACSAEGAVRYRRKDVIAYIEAGVSENATDRKVRRRKLRGHSGAKAKTP